MTGAATNLAAIRPDEWELPLFIHVLSALVLFGALVMATTYLLSAWRSGSAAALHRGLRSLLIAVLPAWLVLRVSAEWISDKQGWNDLDEPPAWIDIGYMVAEPSLLLIGAAAILTGLALRRARSAGSSPSGVAKAAGVIAVLLVVINVVAIWAMTTKPV